MVAACRLTEATSAPTVSTSLPRARTLLFLVAVAAYLTSLGNGFAYDDNWFIVGNPVVTEALIADAFLEPAWPGAPQGVGNYRPVVLTSFAVEWAVFGGNELGFHVVSVLAQGLISLLVLALLLCFVPLLPAFLASLVSESYVAKGDLDAAVRARRAALGQDPTSVSDGTRLGDHHELARDTVSADAARAHAAGRLATGPGEVRP